MSTDTHIQPIIPSWIYGIASNLHKSGFSTYLVGGALRNTALGKPIEDFDLATDAEPSDVIKIFKHAIPTGVQFGTVTVLWRKHKAEITTLRCERNYRDNRHPEHIQFNNDIVKDLARRDFTINAMAYDILRYQFYDPFGGLQDVKQRIIRTVGRTRKRIKEDALRMLRSVRFASQYNLVISQSIIMVCRLFHRQLHHISRERIGAELHKIITSDFPSVGMYYLCTSYLLHIFNIDVKSLQRNSYRRARLKQFPHLFDQYCRLQITDPLECYALFIIVFVQHIAENRSECVLTIVDTICSSLIACGLKNKLIHEAQAIVHAWLMLTYDRDKTIHSYSKIIRSIGRKRIMSFYNVMLSLPIGWLSIINIELFAWCVHNITVYTVKDLRITGNDLIQIGVGKGVIIGHTLSSLLSMTINNPTINNRFDLLVQAKNIHHQEATAIYGVSL